DRKADPRIDVPGGARMRAGRRLAIDADLAKSDPARETLEEAVALGQLLERRGGARREQAEVAGVLRNFLTRAPVDDRVETFHRGPPQPWFVFAVGLGGEHDVVA